jgi:asparagine N-glycosylation enzyme membrane subunit Stt3
MSNTGKKAESADDDIVIRKWVAVVLWALVTFIVALILQLGGQGLPAGVALVVGIFIMVYTAFGKSRFAYYLALPSHFVEPLLMLLNNALSGH